MLPAMERIWGKPDERLRVSCCFPFIFFFVSFSTLTPLGAALERKVGERGHQDHGGVRDDRLQDVLVPAGGDAKEEAG